MRKKVKKILKFRSMYYDAESNIDKYLTPEQKEIWLRERKLDDDPRITKFGKLLRKTSLDELPQLFNVLVGDMSFVGPRPEVPKYVEMYDEEQKNVLLIRPGITDEASILYRNENDVLEQSEDPEKTYIEEVMPKKLALNLAYIQKIGLFYNVGIIFRTLFAVLFK